MTDFIPGQRWISNTESELGLGLIIDVSFKRVTVRFLASDEQRIYAIDNAPLTRVTFAIGDTIQSIDEEELIITGVSVKEGLITYLGMDEFGEEVQNMIMSMPKFLIKSNGCLTVLQRSLMGQL